MPHHWPQNHYPVANLQIFLNSTLSNKYAKNQESGFKFYYCKGYPLSPNIFPFSYKLFSGILSAAGSPLSCCHFSVQPLTFHRPEQNDISAVCPLLSCTFSQFPAKTMSRKWTFASTDACKFNTSKSIVALE